MNEGRIKQSLRDWVAARASHLPDGGIQDDTPLLAQRVVSSLHVMDMVLLIEELTGRPVNVDQLSPGVFRDIDSIFRSFFAEARHV